MVNWEKFQHYKDRNPPWIKFYAELLEDPGVAALPDATKGQLFGIWLLASRLGNRIPADSAFIGKRINASGRVDLKGLITLAFLEPAEECLQHASEVLATCATPSSDLYTETETETETEQRQTSGPAAPPAKRPKPEASMVQVMTWNVEAADDWIAVHGGKPPGAMYKALGGLLKAHTWSRIRPVLRYYITAKPLDYHNWPKFESGFQTYEAEASGAPARASPKTAQTIRALREFVEGDDG